MKHETIATTPQNRNRTTVGVREEVKLSIDPSSAGPAEFFKDGVSQGSGTSVTWTAPYSSDPSVKLKAKIDGKEKEVTFSVIEPTSVEYINPAI